MNNTHQNVRVGLFFMLGLALAWITFESLNGGHLFKPSGYTLVAGFSNLKGLKVGDDVLMAGDVQQVGGIVVIGVAVVQKTVFN